MSPQGPVRVTMVKKRLASGEACQKCQQAEDMLKRRGLWERIDEIVWADEGDATSPGMVLGREHHVDIAPFFLVEQGGQVTVVESVLKLARDLSSGAVSISSANGAAAGTALDRESVEKAAIELAEANPEKLIAFALAALGQNCVIAFSGAEDVAVIDMAVRSGHEFSVFCLDTGRLHAETYRFIERVRKHYGIEIELMAPEPVQLEPFVRTKGLFSFYEDGHSECCGIRKVQPLRRALAARQGWITGQRRDQSPTRADVPQLTWDTIHKPEGMLKVNPLSLLSQADVWAYIREHDVPYNELHDRGFISIGCEPCTRQARQGEHERAARWWWEESTQRECGLHVAADGRLVRSGH